MKKSKQSDEFVAEWQRVIQEAPSDLRQLISAIVRQRAVELSDIFYQHMLSDDEARAFLDHQMVNTRLHASMQRWLCELFAFEQRDPDEIFKHQCHVGEVHARIQVPLALVMRGARMLKHAIHGYLVESALERDELVKAANFVTETMELALDAMTDSFVIDMEKFVRADEGYRMFALGQNMLAERERQNAALLEWAQKILLGLLAEVDVQELQGIRHSAFGMWLQHKASIIFESAPELEQIHTRIQEVEKSMIERLRAARGEAQSPRVLMKEIESGINEIKFLLGGLFDRYIAVESGRDALTRLLNRRYLPSVLTREMALARRTKVPFAVLLLDLDHFKKINDEHGHTGGDLVLQQAADLVTGGVRVGDFVFRYGGEEIMVVLVEIDKAQAFQVAETIREKFASEQMRVSDTQKIRVTVSVGVASYDGHPDFETMIKDADSALYEAKAAGRNRCMLSTR
ncbi:MAG: diguanylate cyclase [Nitrosomonadales bacterium]|nr:diguanylate cyclase [Nitrosomonadales bacterium]